MSEDIENQNQPLVSVIVPVYKVENYLCRAIDSLLNQTYRNLEIILVDDGSPDRCPQICDEYAAKDTRVKVIHKKNSGVSAARNSALEIATGEYLTFLDSDDYLSVEYVYKLVKSLESTGSDVSCCGANIVDDVEHVYNSFCCDCIIEESGVEVAKRMLRDTFPFNFSWGKLFKRNLFEGIRYPLSRLYEDNATTYRVIACAKKVVCIPECLYNYYRGREGNTTSQLNSDKAAWSYYCGCINCKEFLAFCRNDIYKDVIPDIKHFLYIWSKLCIETAIRAGFTSYKDYCKKVDKIIDEMQVDIPLRLRMILAFRTIYYYLYPVIGRNR